MKRRNSIVQSFVCFGALLYMMSMTAEAVPVMTTAQFDGTTYVTGDPIAAYPHLTVPVAGTSISSNAFVLRIDGAQVTTINPFNFSFSAGVFSYLVTTRLQPGRHVFTLFALDSGDGLGATFNVTANVESLEQEVIEDPLAIPNPATHNMRITYKLSQPGDVYVSIYNLNAEKVWEQELTRGMPGTIAGYNEITWNLRSGYGDYCPNGVYLCVISKKDDATGRTVMGKIKLFILR